VYAKVVTAVAQVAPEDILKKIVAEELDPSEGLAALIDRDTGRVRLREEQHIDFKVALDVSSQRGIGELARDILGFANAEGGVILYGVTDDGRVTGLSQLDSVEVRRKVGPFLGTRVAYEFGSLAVNINGRTTTLPFMLIPRTDAQYPHLLRADIELRTGLVQKVKYLRGSLPYRDDAETRIEPTGGDLAEVATLLGFTLVAPRTQTSFLVAVDRPGVRLYDHINDKFIGRAAELHLLLSQFDDVRGRGVSIGGLGGIGKTELAISLVNELHRRKRFTHIYSGSAKRTLLTPSGLQQADPEFRDQTTFLRDLAGWLGIETVGLSLSELEDACLQALQQTTRTLLFIDNLETIDDPLLLRFLNDRIPSNVWLVITTRVHRVRNYLFLYDLGAMVPRDAAKLLRHELKRQGLEMLAATHINVLERMATTLHCHPLAVRWFAWAVQRDRSLWDRAPEGLPKDDLEAFCVSHTLQNLVPYAQDVLMAIAAIVGQTEADLATLTAVAAKEADAVDAALYELECAGLVTVASSPMTGTQSTE